MSFLIPQAALDALVCNSCHKYLSVTPIKVFPNRRMKCGSCVSQNDDGGAISLYNTVAEKSIFKCINHYEGCKVMLNTTEVLEHEATCESKEYVCPICGDLIQSYLVYNHFTNNHKESVLKEPHFLVEQSRNTYQYFLYRYENYLLFVKYAHEIFPNDGLTKTLFNYSLIGDLNTILNLNVVTVLTFGEKTLKKKVNCDVFPSDGGNDLKLDLDLKNNILVVNFLLEVSMVLLTSMPKSDGSIQKATVATNTEEWSHLNIEYLSMLRLNRYFKSRDIYLDDFIKKKLEHGGVLRECNSKREFIFKMTDIKLNCFLCSLTMFCQVKGEILFVKKFEKYYFICHFCSKTQNWQDLYVGASYLENVTYYCKWMCGSHKPCYKIDQHEFDCERQVSQPCPATLCEQRYKSFEIIQHIEDQHPALYDPLYPPVFRNFNDKNYLHIDPRFSPIKQVFVVSHISITIELLWKDPLWEVFLHCKILNALPRMVILNKRGEFIAFIKKEGSFKPKKREEKGKRTPFEKILYTCYLADPAKEEFEKQINIVQ